MTKRTLESFKSHIKKGDKIIVAFCMNGKDGTYTGKELLALLHAVQSAAQKVDAPYEFYVENNEPDYYETWKANNPKFFNDPGLIAAGGVKDINVLLDTPLTRDLKSEYQQAKEIARKEAIENATEKAKRKAQWDSKEAVQVDENAVKTVFDNNMSRDAVKVLKKHPTWAPTVVDHVVNSALYCVAMCKPTSNTKVPGLAINLGNTNKNHLWYGHELSKTQTHALQLAGQFGFDGESLDHYEFNIKNLEAEYDKAHPETVAKQGLEEKQMSVSESSESRSSVSVSPKTSPQNSPPLDPMSTGSKTNSPERQPTNMRGVSPPKLDINEQIRLLETQHKLKLELKEKELEAYKAREAAKVETARQLQAIEERKLEKLHLMKMAELEKLQEIHRTQLQPLALDTYCGSSPTITSTHQQVHRVLLAEEKTKTPAVRIKVTRPTSSSSSYQTQPRLTREAAAGLRKNGLHRTMPSVAISSCSVSEDYLVSEGTTPPVLPRAPSRRGEGELVRVVAPPRVGITLR